MSEKARLVPLAREAAPRTHLQILRDQRAHHGGAETKRKPPQGLPPNAQLLARVRPASSLAAVQRNASAGVYSAVPPPKIQAVFRPRDVVFDR